MTCSTGGTLIAHWIEGASHNTGPTGNAINGRADSAGTASARPKPSPWQRKLRSCGANSQIGIRRLQGPVILVWHAPGPTTHTVYYTREPHKLTAGQAPRRLCECVCALRASVCAIRTVSYNVAGPCGNNYRGDAYSQGNEAAPGMGDASNAWREEKAGQNENA